MAQVENNVQSIQPYDETYNILECAFGDATKRHHFKEKGELIDYIGKRECYHSTFLHSAEIKTFYNTHFNEKGNKTVEKYNGNVWLKQVLIDFDIDETNKQVGLAVLLQNVRNFLHQLEVVYDLNLDYIRINFSGKKGFHIRIPSILFGDFEPSNELPLKIKKLVKKLAGDIHFDETVYRLTGLFRFVNSRNSKSGLCAIPLTSEEIFTLSIDEIKSLAKVPRTIEYFPVDELLPNQEFVALKEEIFSQPSGFTVNLSNVTIDYSDPIWLGVAEGKRDKSLSKIVGYLISKKVDNDKILSIAKLWNSNCNPPENEKIVIKHTLRLIKDYSKDYSDEHQEFWSLNKEKKIIFNKVEYIKFLEKTGFAKYYLGKNLMFIRIIDKKIVPVVAKQVKDYVLTYVRSLNDPLVKEIEETLMNKNNIPMLGENIIECITTIEPQAFRDKQDTAYFYFNNCFVEVTKDGIKTRNYGDLNGYVWQSQTIDYNISLNTGKSDFEKFIFNISDKDEKRFKAIQSAIGYLLHMYKDSSNAKVVVLCDQKISDNPEGRSGKSIIGRAISHMRKAVREEGKNYEFNRFAFQMVEPDTQVLEFNDVKKDFDFECLFSVITDDMTVENKQLKPFIIPFEKSPKILVSTNYTIRGQGGSFRDRLFEIELSDFYNENHKPVDDFGKKFFYDWGDTEWNDFYNFMFGCVKIYLSEGLIYPENTNLTRRKIIDSTCRQFEEFISMKDLTHQLEKRPLFEEFIIAYPELLGMKQNTFTKWIKTYASITGQEVDEPRSGGVDYITVKSA